MNSSMDLPISSFGILPPCGQRQDLRIQAPSFTAYHNSLPYSCHDLVGKVLVYFRICLLVTVIAGR